MAGMVTVRQAKAIVSQWVASKASQAQGFSGAFYHGSINDLAADDLLAQTSDVDLILVIDGPAPAQKPGKFLYQGVIIDAANLALAEIRAAEQVLGSYYLAPSLRSASIIADPTGHLREIQAAVVSGYAKSSWVTRRCEHALNRVRSHLAAIDLAAPGQLPPYPEQVIAWLFGAGVTTHVLLVAGLKNPTVRKRYLAVRDLLAQYQHNDLYPTLLDLLGCAKMTQAQAARRLPSLESVFDAACAAIRSPVPFAADISALARPVAIEGCRELIERGDPREAVFWMAVTFSRCMQVLKQDGPEGLASRHDPAFRDLLASMGIQTSADLRQRSQQVLAALPRVWEAAREIIAANPQVTRGPELG